MFDLMPFKRNEDGFFNTFDRMMNDGVLGDWDSEAFPCRTDILDNGESYVLKADLPGFKKEDIHIGIENDRLVFSAEHKEEVSENKKNYLRRERRYGAVSRSFDLDGIDAGNISASYRDGVLEVTLPKLAEAKPEMKKIEIH
jgi:HSP20 family protein